MNFIFHFGPRCSSLKGLITQNTPYISQKTTYLALYLQPPALGLYKLETHITVKLNLAYYETFKSFSMLLHSFEPNQANKSGFRAMLLVWLIIRNISTVWNSKPFKNVNKCPILRFFLNLTLKLNHEPSLCLFVSELSLRFRASGWEAWPQICSSSRRPREAKPKVGSRHTGRVNTLTYLAPYVSYTLACFLHPSPDALETLKSMLSEDQVPSQLAVTRLVQALGVNSDVSGIRAVEALMKDLGVKLNLSSMLFVNNVALAHIRK